MITTYIVLFGIVIATGWIFVLPSFQINIGSASAPSFFSIYTTIRQYLNYFLGVPIANLVSFFLFGVVLVLIIFGIIKLVRYLIPLI